MSATNRGSERVPQDLYNTDDPPILSLFDNISIGGLGNNKGLNVLECCAGQGNISRIIKERYDCNLHQIDINPENKRFLKPHGTVEICDFRLWHNCAVDEVYFKDGIDVIITNPPYSIAQEIIEHCFKIAPNATVIMLLRLGFLCSQERKEFWLNHPLSRLFALAERPSFGTSVKCVSCDWRQFFPLGVAPLKTCPTCGSKVKTTSTDATDYAWFVWNYDSDVFEEHIKTI